MKAETLKGKIQTEINCGGQTYILYKRMFYAKDVDSAVEWLKKELTPFYKGLISKSDVWHMSKDELCDELEEAVLKKIDEAFGK